MSHDGTQAIKARQHEHAGAGLETEYRFDEAIASYELARRAWCRMQCWENANKMQQRIDAVKDFQSN